MKYAKFESLLTLPRQLCNYGVQAWGRNRAKSKQCVVIREGPLRSGREKKGGVKFVDESNFLSLERFFLCCGAFG